jgi:hypothetical protein
MRIFRLTAWPECVTHEKESIPYPFDQIHTISLSRMSDGLRFPIRDANAYRFLDVGRVAA